MSRKHVLMLGVGLDTPGGITAVVRRYREAGLFERWDVRYVATYEKPGMPTQLRMMSRATLAVLGMLLRGEVRLVHVHSASRGSFWRKSVFCALARLFRVPYIFHLHSGEFPVFYGQECGRMAQAWVRRTLRGAARVVALTEGWRAALQAIEPSIRLTVLGNPVAVPERLPVLRETVSEVLFLGRLREKKGVFDLVRAMPTILAAHPGLRFVMAGDGELEKVRELARSLKVEHALVLPGWIDGDEKDAALARADIFVLPSYFEGLPVGVLEAMAAGVPIVSTTVGGIPDIVQTEKHALLVEPGDVPALSEAIVRLAGDGALRVALREAAFDHARAHFSDKQVLSKLEAMYREIITACDVQANRVECK